MELIAATVCHDESWTANSKMVDCMMQYAIEMTTMISI